ncbi:hypothetical protein NEUTE1DRAFT_39773, partial [Neurospora tetrasperma FGSC 2508]
ITTAYNSPTRNRCWTLGWIEIMDRLVVPLPRRQRERMDVAVNMLLLCPARNSDYGAVPQSLRGMSGFGGQQQQPQQSGRGVANRLPNGKLGAVSGGSGWAFGSGMPMGGSPGVPPGSARQLGGGNVSFAQSLNGRSPTAIGRPHDQRSPVNEEEGRQKPPVYREDGMVSRSSVGDAVSQAIGTRNPLGAIGNDPPSAKGKEEDRDRTNEVQDPLEGMPAIDKFGLKGLRTLMNNFPDYNSLIIGIDPSSLGLELNSSELYSTQIYSILDDVPPRPAVPKFKIPECYMVKNVQPIEAKIQSFNEETLMWIFYSCPGDIKQQLAAAELTTRNWRWHKKLQVWLTKDEMGNTAQLSPAHERGYYIVWDTVNWHKERREFTLYYCDLETNLGVPMPAIGA